MKCLQDQNSKKAKLDFLKGFSQKSKNSLFIKLADRKCNMNDFFTAGEDDYAEWYAFQAYPLLNLLHENMYDIENGMNVYDGTGDVDTSAAKFIEKNSDGRMFESKNGYTGDLDHLLL